MFDTHHVFGPVARKLRPVTEDHCAGLLAVSGSAEGGRGGRRRAMEFGSRDFLDRWQIGFA